MQQNVSISRREMVNFYKNKQSENCKSPFEYLVPEVKEKTHCEEELPNNVKQELSKFVYEYKKWQDCFRNNT